ncbi:MAG: hypothetical protein Q9208_000336 [Pyrenodesmia sp. 3 TL-2023]
MADPPMSNISLSKKVDAEGNPSHLDGVPDDPSLSRSATVEDILKGPHEAHDSVDEPHEVSESNRDEQHKTEGVGDGAKEVVDDDISIASSEMFEMECEVDISEIRQRRYAAGKEVQQIIPSDSAFLKRRKLHDKFAKASGIYVRSLRARVSMLETEIRAIQLQMGSKKEEEYTKVPESLSVDGPCQTTRPLVPVKMTTKDLRNKSPFELVYDGAACLVLGFTSSLDSLQSESTRPRSPMEKTQPGAAELARMMFISPWFSVMLRLLTGVEEPGYKGLQWIYPFKYPLTYLEHLKLLVKTLSEVNLDSLDPGDMSSVLTEAITKVATSLGPKRDDVEISTENTTNILQKEPLFDKHFYKTKQSSTVTLTKEGSEEKSSENHTPTEQLSSSGAADEAGKITCTCLKDARDHLQVLCDAIDQYMSDLLSKKIAIMNHQVKRIKFQDLWLLFKPGDLVITSRKPHLARRVLAVRGGRPLLTKAHLDLDTTSVGVNKHEVTGRTAESSPFTIEYVGIDFDGAKFGPIHESMDISEFDEEKNIAELEAYPMSFSEDPTALQELLLKRGQRFVQLRNFKHKRYTGLSLSDPEEEIDSEVIVDFTMAFRQLQYSKRRPTFGVKEYDNPDCRELYEDRCTDDECLEIMHNRICDDTALDKFLSDSFINAESSGLLHESSNENQALIPLNIDNLSDIENVDAPESASSDFDDLVILEEYKKAVKALVMSRSLGPKDRHQVDLVRGKGKGLIILLHGVPGVGKTSTAECVAAYTKRPLFPITCGDIGQTAREVESNLENIFMLARKWGCVLLLDEADVFLAKRERDSVDRNALVTVFLRALEYYSGILFLTTNRIGTFDEAFISRIHMSLYYPDLDQENTFKVWTMNLDRLKRSGRKIYIDDKAIRAFAGNHWKDGHRWNGRQIRNAFQTALALADYDFHDKCIMHEQIGEKPPIMPVLLADHFKAVAETSAQFHDYLTDVLGGSTHKTKAKMGEVRSDLWQDRGVETPSGKKYSTERASPSPHRQAAVVATNPIEPVHPEGSKAATVGMSEAEEFQQMMEEEAKREKMEEEAKRKKMERFEKYKQEKMAKGL